METLQAMRIAILFVGWPGMAVVFGYVLWQGWQFQLRVKGSPFGRLVLLMVIGWTTSIGFLAFLATLYLQADPRGAGPLSLAFLAFWAANMALIVLLMHLCVAEAVHINLYYAELAAMDKVKTNLINTVAHELNTPLTPVTLKMRLLKDGRFGPLTPEQHQVLDSMNRNLERLSLLIDQVVLSTQIQSGQLQVLALPQPADDWVREVAERFAARAAAEGRRLGVAAATGATVALDRVRMDRVLAALLDNACRFSPKGQAIEVAATVVGNRLAVEVRDGGIGFTPEQRELLFQPMRAAHDPTTNVDVGAGLSLYVSKGIVEAHGGRVWASSPGPGMGAAFGLELPLVMV